MKWSFIRLSFTAGLFSSAIIFLTGCAKKEILPAEQTNVTTDATKGPGLSGVGRGLTPLGYGGTNGVVRGLLCDNYISGATTKVEIAIWEAYIDGEHNSVNVGVDPGFVLVGGGAQITDLNGNWSAINAVLTSAFPVNDGTFSTYSAASKDHGGTVYYHRLYVYAIGIRLFGTDGNPIPTSTLIPYFNLSSTTSFGAVSHPYATIAAPTGYTVLSGGADIHYGTGYGNLLVNNSFNQFGNYTEASGKDQKTVSTATITDYCLSMNNTTIPGFGSLLIHYDAASTPIFTHLQEIGMATTPGYLLAGISAFSNYNTSTGYGRLLFGMYPFNGFNATIESKDQVQSDMSGTLEIKISEVAPAQ